MQITDMLNQYNRNIANGTEISSGTQGIKQVVSSIQEMSVGNVFEGNINQIEDGVVTLGIGFRRYGACRGIHVFSGAFQ